MRTNYAYYNLPDSEMVLYYIKRSFTMTQHPLQGQTDQDALIMRRLGIVIAGFFVFTIILGVTVGAIMG